MNKKHYDMVYAWVQKKLGDLAPDVLSEEVKYKILFKIYKKKYKKAKRRLNQRKEVMETSPLNDYKY